MTKYPDQFDRLVAARLTLIFDHVFFGCLAMRLRLVEDETLQFAAATDGKVILYNPHKIKDMSREELVGLVAHEAGHPLLLHHTRRGNRDPLRWNIAADIKLNLLLIESFKERGEAKHSARSIFKLPEGGLVMPEYAPYTTEEIYDRLPKQDQQNEKGKGQSGMQAGRFDEVLDGVGDGGEKLTEAQALAEEGRIKAEIQNAANLARKAGQMTASLEQFVEALCEPKAPWRQILQDYVTMKAETDYNWARPHQRMMHQYGIVYPTLDGEKLGQIVCLLDASGSCYNEQEQFCSELSDILEQYDCEVHVVFHDTEVKRVDRYESSDLPIVLYPKGFGGSCAISSYNYIEENFAPDLLVHLTDGEMSFGKIPPPSCDCLIACTERRAMKNLPGWAAVIDIS